MFDICVSYQFESRLSFLFFHFPFGINDNRRSFVDFDASCTVFAMTTLPISRHHSFLFIAGSIVVSPSPRVLCLHIVQSGQSYYIYLCEHKYNIFVSSFSVQCVFEEIDMN